MGIADASNLTDADVGAAWLLRRVGFGASTADLDHARNVGLERFLDELLDPAAAGVPDDGDPWEGLDISLILENPSDLAAPIRRWLQRLAGASRPTSEWIAWFWHGHLVSGISAVRSPLALVNQLRLFRGLGAGHLEPLLAAITIDAAMLRYLDGDRSTGNAPNENYSRELLELFALGVGNFSEADVQSGAVALTGWTRARGRADAQFVTLRHDDTPQDYLGVAGVHDVESVIAAVVAHEACAVFVATSLAESILGPNLAAKVGSEEADQFRQDDLHVGSLVRRLCERGLQGECEPVVVAPVPWLMGALRATGAELADRVLVDILRSSGQVPLNPPNVSGWPTGEAWLSSSATTARLSAAQAVADAAPSQGAAMVAASSGDLAELARALGRPSGFSATTNSALVASRATGRSLLALSLSTPEMVIA